MFLITAIKDLNNWAPWSLITDVFFLHINKDPVEEALPWPFTSGFPSIKSTNFEKPLTKTSTIQSVARPRNIDGGQRFTSNSVENNGVDITERSTTTTTNKFISTTTENHRKNDRRNNVRAISVPSGSRNNQPVCNKYILVFAKNFWM